MKNSRFIIGIIVGHIISYLIKFNSNPYDVIFLFFDIIAWGYLLYIFFLKQTSKLCRIINQWLMPIIIMYCVMQLPFYLILLLGDNGLNFLLFPLWLYRFTLLIEIPLAYIIYYIYMEKSK